ncbi:MAG TPA: hypothetical protein VG692_12750 [Gemmatimonadales bacterium]|nr:hypothetical protein [Gemmatimonadales bacterium]
MRSLSLALGALVVCAPLSAQDVCKPGSGSREADLFGHFSVPLAFSLGQSPWIYRPGSIQFGLEGTLLPDASDRIATPTKCRPGKGPENVNLLSAFPRPRLGFALGDGVLLEVSWIPPVTRLNGVRTNLWGVALSRSVLLTPKGTMFMGRVHATLGNVRAPFVCPESATRDATNVDCFGGQESDDRYSPNIFGVELGFAWPMARGRLRPYLGSGYNILHPRFQVDRIVAGGAVDNQKVEVNLSRWALFGGLTWAPNPGFMLSTEAYTAPSDAITARVKGMVVVGGRRKMR